MNDLMMFEVDKLKNERKLGEEELIKSSKKIAEMLKNGMGEEMLSDLSQADTEIITESKPKDNFIEKLMKVFRSTTH